MFLLPICTIVDYERYTQHQMTLQAADKAFNPRHIYTVLTINVVDSDDNPPVFSQSKYTAQVLENEPAGVLAVNISATDADTGRNGDIR